VNDITFLINYITLSVNKESNFKKSIAIIKISSSVAHTNVIANCLINNLTLENKEANL
jgi:hypothetical protein